MSVCFFIGLVCGIIAGCLMRLFVTDRIVMHELELLDAAITEIVRAQTIRNTGFGSLERAERLVKKAQTLVSNI